MQRKHVLVGCGLYYPLAETRLLPAPWRRACGVHARSARAANAHTQRGNALARKLAPFQQMSQQTNQQMSAPLGCRIRHSFPNNGLGSAMRTFLEQVLLPAAREGLPPGSIDIEESSFWYGCSPSRGFRCYFDPVPPSPAALSTPSGTAAVQRECSLQDLQQLRRPRSSWHNVSLLNRAKLDEARAAMRLLWRYSSSTRSWLHRTLPNRSQHASKSNAPPLVSVHLRRGDKFAEELQNNLTFTPIVRVAQRIRQEVSRVGLAMDAVQVHIMFDDSKAAGELVSRLNLAASAVVMRPSVGAAPANGFAACLSPRRFGKGQCNCTLEDRNSRRRHDPHWAVHCLMHGKLITEPLTHDQVRDEMRGILFDLELAQRARLFLGSCNSNTGHLVQLLRSQRPESAVCLDTRPGHMFKGICEEQDCDVRSSKSAAQMIRNATKRMSNTSDH